MTPVRAAVHLLLALLLGGCAAFEQDVPAQPGKVDWQVHSQHISSLQHWTARGKVSLRSAQAAESASLLWRQQENETDLQLLGPLGVGATYIRSDGRQLDIRRGDEWRTLDISTPDAIRESTGWDLPIKALAHWMKGLPSPDSAVQALDLDPDTGLLRQLTQDDWQVHYRTYGEFNRFTLPRHLEIQRGMTKAKVLISHWQTTPD